MSTNTLFYSIILFSTLVVCDPPNISCSQAILYSPGYTCPTEKKLGSGASAIAFKITDSQGKPALVKVQKVDDPDRKTAALREVSILEQCNHENVIKIFSNVEKNKLMYTVLEIGELGSLESLITKQPDAFNDALFLLEMFKGLLRGTSHIHSKGFCHADLKTGNVVVGSGYVPKIIDFDLATPYNKPASRRGTPLYMDPNVILADKDPMFDDGPDIYSLGIILYEMSHRGLTPFEGLKIDRIIEKLIAGKFVIVEGTDLMVAYLISRCTLTRKSDRLSIPQMLMEIETYYAGFSDQKIQKTTIDMNVKMEMTDFKILGQQKVTDIPLGNVMQFGQGANNKLLAKKDAPKMEIPKGPIKAVDLNLGGYVNPVPTGVDLQPKPTYQKKVTYDPNPMPQNPLPYDYNIQPAPVDYTDLVGGYKPSQKNDIAGIPNYTPLRVKQPSQQNNIGVTPGYTPLHEKGFARLPTGYKEKENGAFQRAPEMNFNIVHLQADLNANGRDSLAYIENPEVREIVRKYRKKHRALGGQKTATEEGLYNHPIQTDGSSSFGLWLLLTFFSLAISVPFAAFLGKRMVSLWTRRESVLPEAQAAEHKTPAVPANGGVVSITN